MIPINSHNHGLRCIPPQQVPQDFEPLFRGDGSHPLNSRSASDFIMKLPAGCRLYTHPCRHANFTPCAPVNAHPRQALSAPFVDKGIHKGISRRIVGLSTGAYDRRRRRKTDEEIERFAHRSFMDVQCPPHLRCHHFPEPVCILPDEHCIVDDSSRMDNAPERRHTGFNPVNQTFYILPIRNIRCENQNVASDLPDPLYLFRR